jgi:hypothetical protein
MEDKRIAAMEFVQAVDMCMDIEAGNPTNVDIFYLFLAMPFLIHSFTNILCMALGDARTDTLPEDTYNQVFHTCPKDTRIPRHRPCRVIHTRILVYKQCMAARIHIVDRPTTILEAMETSHKSMGYRGSPIPTICRTLCRSRIASWVSAKAVGS